jgi:hypothetical protein
MSTLRFAVGMFGRVRGETELLAHAGLIGRHQQLAVHLNFVVRAARFAYHDVLHAAVGVRVDLVEAVQMECSLRRHRGNRNSGSQPEGSQIHGNLREES